MHAYTKCHIGLYLICVSSSGNQIPLWSSIGRRFHFDSLLNLHDHLSGNWFALRLDWKQIIICYFWFIFVFDGTLLRAYTSRMLPMRMGSGSTFHLGLQLLPLHHFKLRYLRRLRRRTSKSWHSLRYRRNHAQLGYVCVSYYHRLR